MLTHTPPRGVPADVAQDMKRLIEELSGTQAGIHLGGNLSAASVQAEQRHGLGTPGVIVHRGHSAAGGL
jgi:hypothetical protein